MANAQNSKTKGHARKSLIWTIVIVSIVCLILIVITSVVMVFCSDKDIFSTAVSNGNQMNIPFTIFIEVLTTTAGIIIGLQIDNYVDEKKGKNSYHELMERIKNFVRKLYLGIEGNDGDEKKATVFTLAQFKLHWDLMLGADAFAVQTLQQDNDFYFELAYIFNFLHYNEKYWSDHSDKTIAELKMEGFTVKADFLTSLDEWVTRVKMLHDDLTTNNK